MVHCVTETEQASQAGLTWACRAATNGWPKPLAQGQGQGRRAHCPRRRGAAVTCHKELGRPEKLKTFDAPPKVPCRSDPKTDKTTEQLADREELTYYVLCLLVAGRPVGRAAVGGTEGLKAPDGGLQIIISCASTAFDLIKHFVINVDTCALRRNTAAGS